MNPVEQAHQNLKNVLLNGRIIINGLPLTASELSSIIQGELRLYEKATKLDSIASLDKEKSPVNPPQVEKK